MLFREWWMALGFLTTLPTPTIEYDPDAFVRAARWYPLVGLLIGTLLWLAYTGLTLLFSPLIVAVLVVLLWAALTGSLHLDGLADCCDGLLAPFDRERRLEIMRDSRVGAFAVIGLGLFLMLKVAAITSLPSAVPAMLMAPTWSRWLLLPAARQPMARSSGMGSAFADSMTIPYLVVALIVPVGLLLITSLNWEGVVAVAVAYLAFMAICRFARQRIGGLTGDVFGLIVEVGEGTILLIYAIGFQQLAV